MIVITLPPDSPTLVRARNRRRDHAARGAEPSREAEELVSHRETQTEPHPSSSFDRPLMRRGASNRFAELVSARVYVALRATLGWLLSKPWSR